MDVADAVNIMQFSSARPDGGEGGAVWDIFAAEDTPKIRSFLRSLGKKNQTAIDPIHSQTHYLDTKLMQQLFEVEGVTSYRIFQRPGQAVFIPAGCAHQVCWITSMRLLGEGADITVGVQLGGLHQGSCRLCQPAEHPALRTTHAGVPRAEPWIALEGGYPPAQDDAVVRVALMLAF